MKFNKETLAILNNFRSINPGIVLKKGNTIMTRTISKTVYAEATLDDHIDTDMAIYDLKSFLSVLSLVGDDADIEHDVETSTIKITNDNTQVFYASSDESVVVQQKKKLNFPVADVIFELSADNFQQITRISQAMAADTIAFTNKDGKILVNGYNKGVDSELSNVLYSLELGDWDGEDDFNFVINLQNMKFLLSDYKVSISSKGCAKFEAEKFAYIIVLEIDSSSTF